ncbi:uncharacterized protein LOC143281486 [Babylonia areolata]|uniref:uncharacterized protein LOC143281486 n=1 Tax=Babylonia areolata TaxID=304850 RepID=UPI003FD00C3B
MNSSTRNLLWLALVVLTWGHVTDGTLFKLLPLDDVMFTEDVLWEKPARVETECSLMCAGDARCVLSTFAPGPEGSAGRCRTHSKRQRPTWRTEAVSGARTFTPVTTDKWIEKVCTSNSDCTEYMAACYSGMCLCDGGFFFDNYLNGCTSTCTRNLGNSYLKYLGWDLFSHDLFSKKAYGTMSTCEHACNADHSCTAFSYLSHVDTCYFKQVTAQDYPKDWRVYNLSTHCRRTCA